jgi:hypothetical protein
MGLMHSVRVIVTQLVDNSSDFLMIAVCEALAYRFLKAYDGYVSKTVRL